MPELTPEQHRRFHEQGHLVVDHFVSPERVAELISAFERQAEAWADEIDTPVEDYLAIVSQWTNVRERNSTFKS